jgi:hypothetical protein
MFAKTLHEKSFLKIQVMEGLFLVKNHSQLQAKTDLVLMILRVARLFNSSLQCLSAQVARGIAATLSPLTPP